MPNKKPWERPWHSKKTDVYHNNSSCKIGIKIEKENLRVGDGGKTLCEECKRLNENK